MFQVVLLGLVAVLATLTGGYAGLNRSAVPVAVSQGDRVELAKLEPVSIPIIERGKVSGYVVARVTFAADSDDLKVDRAVFASFVTEAVYRNVYKDERFRFSDIKRAQLHELGVSILGDANARLGREAIKKVVIENLQFVSRDEVRCADKR